MNSYLNNEVLRVEREPKQMISHGDFSGGSNRYNSNYSGQHIFDKNMSGNGNS